MLVKKLFAQSALVLSSVFVASLAFGAFAEAAAPGTTPPQKVPALFEKVFTPHGFDSNDNVQLVGVGTYENGCYRPAETTVRVDQAAKKIFVTPAAYKYAGYCTQLILRFDRVIDVGIVPAGNYEIYQEKQSTLLGKISVAQAKTDDPDDYLYAPVKQAYIDDKGSDKAGDNEREAFLVLKGMYPTSCMEIKEILVNSEDNVIVVQPIMSVAKRDDCAVGLFPFRKMLKVTVPKGEYLLHIRSMNAKAVNSLIDIM